MLMTDFNGTKVISKIHFYIYFFLYEGKGRSCSGRPGDSCAPPAGDGVQNEQKCRMALFLTRL